MPRARRSWRTLAATRVGAEPVEQVEAGRGHRRRGRSRPARAPARTGTESVAQSSAASRSLPASSSRYGSARSSVLAQVDDRGRGAGARPPARRGPTRGRPSCRRAAPVRRRSRASSPPSSHARSTSPAAAGSRRIGSPNRRASRQASSRSASASPPRRSATSPRTRCGQVRASGALGAVEHVVGVGQRGVPVARQQLQPPARAELPDPADRQVPLDGEREAEVEQLASLAQPPLLHVEVGEVAVAARVDLVEVLVAELEDRQRRRRGPRPGRSSRRRCRRSAGCAPTASDRRRRRRARSTG